ncbi:MAG: nucleoside recognition domain-containing protein [Clostridiaceae bacterium]|nr:nucleoside recognition domain-containing protein [Clostridiaceae bacterium]
MDRPIVSRLLSNLTFCLITLFGAGLILFTKDVSAAATNGISLCLRVVIPSLFPFFVLSSLFISSGFAMSLSKFMAKPLRLLFRLPGACSPAIVMGLIGGYPVGAKTAFDLYDNGSCSAGECSRLLIFCSNCGPAFIFSAVGASIFGSLKAGAVIYLCHIASALLIGMVSGFFSPKTPDRPCTAPASTSQRFPSAFVSSVSSSFTAMLNVCGFVIFFSSLMAFLKRCGFISLFIKLLFFLEPKVASALVEGIFEMTGGVSSVAAAGLGVPGAMALCAFIIGWGGISVHSQVISLMGDRPISMSGYFKGKMLHAVISSAMTYAFSIYFLKEASVCAPIYANGYYIASPMYFIIVMGIYLALALLLSFLTMDFGKKAK